MTLVDAIEGDEVLFEAVSAPSYGPDQRRTGMVTVLRDVTDLRRADEELRANYDKLRQAEEVVRQDRDRLNLIIENVGDPIVVCDRDAKVVLLDPLAQELLGSEKNRSGLHMRNQTKLDAYVTKFTYSFSDRESAPHPAHSSRHASRRGIRRALRKDLRRARPGSLHRHRAARFDRGAPPGAVEDGAAHAGDGEVRGGRPAGWDHRPRSQQSSGGHQELHLHAERPDEAGSRSGLRNPESRDRACRPHCPPDAGSLSQYRAGGQLST